MFHSLRPQFFASVIAILFCFHTSIVAQCVSSVPISLDNPSFEGVPDSHWAPAPWSSCWYTPDTQPGFFGVAEPASDGNTYLGLAASEPNWLEGAAQELLSPLNPNTLYGFEIDLSATNAAQGGISPNEFTSLEIWGGDSLCDNGELLWSSPIINHVGWQTYSVSFVPVWEHDFVHLVVAAVDSAYLLVDNIKEPSDQTSILEIITPTDSLSTSCSFNLAGTVDETTIDSVLVEGGFQNSPLSIAVSDSSWNTHLLYTEAGYDGITVSAFYTDSASGIPIICSQVTLTIEVTAPKADFIVTGNCSNIPFEFEDFTIPFDTNSIISWTWDFAGLGNSTDQNPTALLDTSGLIDVQLMVESSDGCMDDTTISVEVSAAPNTNFSFTEVCVGYSTNFHDLSDEGDENIISWLWNFDDGSTSSLQNPEHLFGAMGEYDVLLIIIDQNGCSDSIVQGVEVFRCASVNEAELSALISIYPNPVTDHLRIESEQYTINRFRIFDSAGKMIMAEDVENGTVSTIALPHLSYGVYSLELTINDNGVISKPFIIR